MYWKQCLSPDKATVWGQVKQNKHNLLHKHNLFWSFFTVKICPISCSAPNKRRGGAGYKKQQNYCQHIKINQLTVFQSPELLTKDNKLISKPTIQPAHSDTILFFHEYISHSISFHLNYTLKQQDLTPTHSKDSMPAK